MGIKLFILVVVIFGGHAIIEYCSGGFKNDEDCRLYGTRNRYYIYDSDSIFEFKTNK